MEENSELKAEWKDIKGFEGLYQVFCEEHTDKTEIRVRSLDRVVVDKNGVSRQLKGKELTPLKEEIGSHTYYTYTLCKNGVERNYSAYSLAGNSHVKVHKGTIVRELEFCEATFEYEYLSDKYVEYDDIFITCKLRIGDKTRDVWESKHQITLDEFKSLVGPEVKIKDVSKAEYWFWRDIKEDKEMLGRIKRMSQAGSEVATKHLDKEDWVRRFLYEGNACGSNDFFNNGEWNLSFHATGKCGEYGSGEGICGEGHSYIYIDGVIEEPEFCENDAILAIEGYKGDTRIWLYIHYGENYYKFIDGVEETSEQIQEGPDGF